MDVFRDHIQAEKIEVLVRETDINERAGWTLRHQAEDCLRTRLGIEVDGIESAVVRTDLHRRAKRLIIYGSEQG